MNGHRLALPGAVAAWRAPLQARWQALGARERRALLIAGAALALLLVWLLAIQPAWRTARDAPAQIDKLDAQLHTMQRQAAQARELRNLPTVSSGQAQAALKAATERLGASGRLLVVGDRATLTLTNAQGDQLRSWLAESRSAARARPLEASLARGAQGYSGSVVVALPGGSSP